DLDGDGKKEAIAFYSKADKEEKQMHLNLLIQDTKDYKSSFDFSIIAASVEKIEFCDFNRDGTKEIVAGFEVYGKNEKSLVAFKFQSGKLVELMRTEYTNFLCNDLLNDGTKQLIIQKITEKNTTNTAIIYSLSGKTFSKISSCSLDGNVTSVSRMVYATLSSGKPAVYIDEIKGVGAITEMLTVSGKSLGNPLAAANNNAAGKIRSAGIPFFDINGDGFLEIPIPADDAASVENGVNHINWCDFDGKELTVKESAFVNVIDGYSIVLPKSLYGKIKVTKNAEKRLRRIYYVSGGEGSTEKEIFSITVVSKDETDEYSGEILADKNGELFIIEYKDSARELGFEKSDLIKMFRFNDF
ncbi:MAG: hypothetical protein J5766_05485, partial [Clostridia bacterium]|nr:hypothetical protein [Clostridia bacterium]